MRLKRGLHKVDFDVSNDSTNKGVILILRKL